PIRMGGPSARAPVAPVAPEPVAPIAPEPARAVAPIPAPTVPRAPIKPSQPLPSPTALRPPSAVPAAAVAPIAVAVAPDIVAPAAEPQPAAVPVETLMVPLIKLRSGWPAVINQVLAHLSDAMVAVPTDELEQALKRGKIAFPWKRIRSWIIPSPPPTAASAVVDTSFDLPLPVV